MSGLSVAAAVNTLAAPDAARMRMVLERGVKIPAQPRVVQELRKLLASREADVRVLARVINQDPALTAMLFKVVRSAAYKRHQPFETVAQIVHALGVEETFNLVQAISLAGIVEVRSNRLAYEAFWVRSQAVGQLAMLVAEDRVAVCNMFPDQAYLAGIFHDCGVPLLMQRFPTYCAEMRLGEQGRWIELGEEDRKFNADHCVVGYIVARHWNLPEFICDAVRYHHEIASLGLHAARSMVAILLLAIHIFYRDQRVGDGEWAAVEEEVLSELGIHADALPEFVDVILERYHEQQEP